jgi:hypothetical protein
MSETQTEVKTEAKPERPTTKVGPLRVTNPAKYKQLKLIRSQRRIERRKAVIEAANEVLSKLEKPVKAKPNKKLTREKRTGRSIKAVYSAVGKVLSAFELGEAK